MVLEVLGENAFISPTGMTGYGGIAIDPGNRRCAYPIVISSTATRKCS